MSGGGRFPLNQGPPPWNGHVGYPPAMSLPYDLMGAPNAAFSNRSSFPVGIQTNVLPVPYAGNSWPNNRAQSSASHANNSSKTIVKSEKHAQEKSSKPKSLTSNSSESNSSANASLNDKERERRKRDRERREKEVKRKKEKEAELKKRKEDDKKKKK